AEQPEVGDTPQAHRLVPASGGERGAVRGERHARHEEGVTGQRTHDGAGRHAEYAYRVVSCAGGEQLPVRRERDREHLWDVRRPVVTDQRADQDLIRDPPDVDLAALVAGGEQGAVRGDRHRVHQVRLRRAEVAGQRAVADAPQLHVGARVDGQGGSATTATTT